MKITMKRALRISILSAAGLACAVAAGEASAHTDVSVMLGVPGPVYVAPPPPVVYQEAPVAYAAPAYGYVQGYGYRGDDDDRRWHDHGRHRGWYKHHHDDDDEQ